MKNDYYEIACNDLLFLQAVLHTDFYNQIVVWVEQVVEKMLKSVAERCCVGIESLMHTHNLRAIYDEIHKVLPDFSLDRHKLSTLKDFYFDAKYPGNNFITASKEDCAECLETMYHVVSEVNKERKRLDLPCMEYEVKMLGDSSAQEINVF